ncbi:hypothetical protein ACK6D9_12110 [Hoeflea sp. Naph1]|uniref:hypothetical protein n=1 Tax=Hoeflea sp. Naph1 TaxID=3388653 RepID=UPI00398F9FB3
MAQPKPIEKPANGRAMHINTAPGEFDAEFIECHFAIRSDTGANPFAMRRQLAGRPADAPAFEVQASRWHDAGSSCC